MRPHVLAVRPRVLALLVSAMALAFGCGPWDECQSDSDCEYGHVCGVYPHGERYCAVPCTSNDDCLLGTACHVSKTWLTNDSRCVPGCQSNDECAADEFCRGIECAKGCRVDEQCPDGQACFAGACSPGCSDDRRCKSREICLDYVCVEGCRTDQACAEGETCVCAKCKSTCRGDADCPSGAFCDAKAGIFYCDAPACVEYPTIVPVECSGVTCGGFVLKEPFAGDGATGFVGVAVSPCCVATTVCGVDFSPLGVGSCQVPDFASTSDSSCPIAEIFPFPPLGGCRRSDGLCGVSVALSPLDGIVCVLP